MSNFLLKRTTLIVGDVTESIAFYSAVVGMSEYYNRKMSVGGKVIPAGDPNAIVHLGIMEGAHRNIGKLGLLEWCSPRLPEKPTACNQHLTTGKAFFECETPDIEMLFAGLQNSARCAIYSPPYERVVLERPGGDKIEVRTLSFFDSDGFFFEVNQKPNSLSSNVFTIKSTILVVRDIEASLAFYTKALGMEVWSERVFELGENILPTESGGGRVRLVFLKCGTPDIGMLGLLQCLEPVLKKDPPYEKHLKQGGTIFVAETDDLSLLNSRISAAQEVSKSHVHCSPQFDQVTDAHGSVINMSTMSFFDPDGFFYELNMRTSSLK